MQDQVDIPFTPLIQSLALKKHLQTIYLRNLNSNQNILRASGFWSLAIKNNHRICNLEADTEVTSRNPTWRWPSID